MRGEVVYFRVVTLGASVDLEEIRRSVEMAFLAGREPSERAAPKYVRLPDSLLVTVDRRTLETNLGTLTMDLTVRLYEVGALAITLRTPFEVPVLRDLVPFTRLLIMRERKAEDLDAFCERIAARIEEDLVPYLRDSVDLRTPPEPYVAFCITDSDVSARAYVESRRRDVTALLAADPRPEDISDEEIEDTWKNWLSYYRDDLIVIEWDAALVVEPTGKYEDTLAVIELANLQLLELRSYDAYLDQVIDTAYDDVDDFFARGGLFKSGREMVRELAEVRMDLAEMTDEVQNISKFFGDWFLGKLYLACARKFDLEAWRRVVNEKMKALTDIYHVAQAEVDSRRMFWLELLIVLLFVVDLVIIVYLG